MKNVTWHSVLPVVAKNNADNAVLSQLKDFCRLDREPRFVTRGEWAGQLRINPKTIKRWEDQIINSNIKFAYLYYDGKSRKGKSKLDLYQRFFLSLIYALKEGLATGYQMTNLEVIQYLEASVNGKPRWMMLTRKEFQQWDEVYRNDKAS